MREDVELLFRHNPQAGIKFLYPLLMIGIVTSIMLMCLDVGVLAGYLGHCGGQGDTYVPCGISCGLPGLWVSAHAALAVMQLPFRTVLLRRLHVAAGANGDQQAAVQLLVLNRSLAWSVNKKLGVANLAWFVGGLVVMRIYGGGPCGLTRLLCFHLVLFVIRCVSTFLWFAATFGNGHQNGLAALPSIYRASTARALVAQRPTRTYRVPGSGEGGGGEGGDARFQMASCVVCLADYEDGEALCELACHHYFHAACLEQWFEMRRICPLCQAPAVSWALPDTPGDDFVQPDGNAIRPGGRRQAEPVEELREDVREDANDEGVRRRQHHALEGR